MKKAIVLSIAVVVFSASFVSAELVQGINIDFVPIGNAGNAGDTRTEIDSWGYPMASPYGCGAVGYNYRIGMHEVTNAQWNVFVTAAGAPTGNPSNTYNHGAYYTGTKEPTDYISWYEAAQFCNYLTSGDKSKGAYQFSGNNVNPGDFLGVNRNAAISSYGTIYVIPTEDEWYKAAYFKPNGSGYSLYANGLDIAPIAGIDTNYNNGYMGGSIWNVGTGMMEQNGTFDMMGNLWEWNETLIGLKRGLRGGFTDYNTRSYQISSACQYQYDSLVEHSAIGFRVASIPEPTSLLLLGLGGMIIKKRK